MKRTRFPQLPSILIAIGFLAGLWLVPALPASADTTAQPLIFSQDWQNTSLISTDDQWNAVPGITGYRGDNLTAGTGADPQQIVAEGTPTIDVLANQANPNSLSTGGVAEFEMSDSVVALQGSGTADAPNLVLALVTTGKTNIRVHYRLRDLDGSGDNAVQPVALQYRVGTSGDFTNVPAGFVADATEGPNLSGKETVVDTLLPAAADQQAVLQVRIITSNATDSDEWVGIDDLVVGSDTGAPVIGLQPGSQTITEGSQVALRVVAMGAGPLAYQWYQGASGDTSVPVAGATDSTYTTALNTTTSFWVRVSGASAPAADSTTATVTVQAAPSCDVAVTPIGQVQGIADQSPLLNQSVTVRGTVTGDFQDSSALSGFYVQDAGDSNAQTSDGVLVYVPAANPLSNTNVAVGDVVQVTGSVSEFQGQTELANLTQLTQCGTASPVVPTPLTLPEQTNGEFERYEGMLVTISQTLTVEQNYFQGRYGQVTVGVGRLFQPTNLFRPGTAEALALADLNARSLIVLDDARSAQNPNPIPYIGEGATLRAGDTVSGLVGILDFGPINSDTSIRDYRIQPTVPTASIVFTRENPRTPAPAEPGGNVTVASANVLNYFTTFDETGAACYPSNARSDCRGANSAAEFSRQRTKITTELLAMDADIIGLMEIENNGPTAVGDLVAGLNAVAGTGTYTVAVEPTNDPVADPQRLGDDAIKVALIYKPGVVTPVGQPLSSGDTVFSRAPFAQTFSYNANGTVFSVIVNHFKSKGSCPSSPSTPNADQGDGQGCWNALRVEQSQALLGLITQVKAASGSNDVLVIGDLNSYGYEDPIATLTEGGMVNLLARWIDQPYSYVFDGLAGYLDHALASESMATRVSGVTEWHTNADEPSVIDYNTEFKPQDLYAPTSYRASDHDPVLIGLNMGMRYFPFAERSTE